MKLISRKEELLLLIIWRLGDNAYGVPIREEAGKATGRYWSIGAVYDVLDRLTRNGLVTAITGDPLAERGGKAKRFYTITAKGHKALEEVRELHQSLWQGLPERGEG